MRLDGKVAIVTGGASGLGFEIAKEFFREGARVAIADINKVAAVDAAEEIGRANEHPQVVSLDVRNKASVDSCVDEVIEKFGRIDLLVNSAGISRLRPFLELTVEDFDLVHEVNLRGTFLVAQAVARTMIGKGGAIINIASASGRRGSYGRTAYGPGKAGVIRLTEIMAVELAKHNIRVNGIAPGPIETPIVSQLATGGREFWTAVVPMGRFGRPIEVARAAVFLASDDASYMTGTTLDVDGGFAGSGILKG